MRLWEIATGRTIPTVTLPQPVDLIVAVTADQFIVLDRGLRTETAQKPRPPIMSTPRG